MAVTTIHSLCWDEVNRAVPVGVWAPEHGRVFVVWPAPVDHDACLAEAGFSDFADSTEHWAAEFMDLTRSLVEFLAGVVGGRAPPKLAAGLVAAARADDVPPCVVHLGTPAQAAVRTSNGHPLLWVWTGRAGVEREALLASVARGRPVVHTTLDWKSLA